MILVHAHRSIRKRRRDGSELIHQALHARMRFTWFEVWIGLRAQPHHAREAGRLGPRASTALIAADEVAVERFLTGTLDFPGIVGRGQHDDRNLARIRSAL